MTTFKTVRSFRNGALFLFLLTGYSALPQIKQTVNGIVTDELSKPLAGANVILSNADSTLMAASDDDGRFTFLASPGRYFITVSFTGFSAFNEEVLVIAGKSPQLAIVLRQTIVQLKDVEVSSRPGIDAAGGYSISIEKTMRVPANFFDPVRMATSLPGVVATNDQGNSISIKGYSPNALLWRLQGLDIVNPNHLANAGTLSDKPVANGGGVSILSSQVLDQTKFYSGALPVQYGNALSGALDMSLRAGNKIKREHTVQASLIGIDLATEGPMGKIAGEEGAKSSYLVNYRYSTVGLLSLAGINFGDEKINFQDLTFHLDFDQRKGRHLSIFGFGGLSSNEFDRKPETEWETEKDRYDIDFKGKVFGIGMSSTLYAGLKSNLKVGLAYSGQYQDRHSQSADITLPIDQYYIYRENYQSNRSLLSGSIDFAQRFSSFMQMDMGVLATSYQQYLNVETVSQTILTDPYPNMKGSVNGVLWQPYLNTKWTTRFVDIAAGVRYVYFGYNASSSVEPRLTATSTVFKGQLALSYGITSQMQQTQTYLADQNQSLKLTRAHQWMASYRKSFVRGFSFTVNAFHHKLFDVPVSAEVHPFSTINQMNEFAPNALTSTGLGKNYGADLLLENKFLNSIYFMAGGSWYATGYSNGTSAFYTSRYNGKFTITLSGGKEWNRRKNKTFGVHIRTLYLGGLRQQEINMADSQSYGDTRYNDNNVYPIKLPDYYRLDLRVSWRKNKPGYTRTLSIDIQNLTNQLNVAYYYYDTHTQKKETKYQLGLIPVLVYRIDF
jgi:hypothetical protein